MFNMNLVTDFVRYTPATPSHRATIAKRKKATDQTRAANIRQCFTHDPIPEAANARHVAGESTSDNFREQMKRIKRASR